MGTHPTDKASSKPRLRQRVLVATTAMLSFISFWRAAAIVLNDIGSSAFYAGGIAEHAFGKAAPWFILAIMLLAYAVRSIYMESSSILIRGGVYRAVKKVLGNTPAKFAVSALIFDYILTAPISGVAAGQYLVRFLNEVVLFDYFHIVLPINLSAAIFAGIVTLYFWRQNIKGIPESSHKAMKIMQITTVMVVIMIGWGLYTLWVRGASLPPLPFPSNLHFSPEALGWLRGSQFPYMFGLLGIFIALGHSVLAMSGEETLAQVYREIEHPKFPNLRKVGFIIVIYSLLFTALVSFFAVMIIPDEVRAHFLDNLIAGLAMNFEGPYALRLVFHAFVVVVGVLMLSGAVNTAIVGANSVLNRVAEDGILHHWFRHPHPHFGTSNRVLNLVVGMQLLAIVLSRGDVFVLGEAYAFGVLWSFVMNGVAVTGLRFKSPGPREYRVPFNMRFGKIEIPFGICIITLTLIAIAVVNLFTKQIATVSGIAFTLFFFGVFTISEKISKRHGDADTNLDQFHVEVRDGLSPERLGVRPRNILVPVSNPHTLYHLASALDNVKIEYRDVVVLRIRLFQRVASGEYDLEPEQLFGKNEERLFTEALRMAEKHGKSIHLAVISANDLWTGIIQAAKDLQSSSVFLGRFSRWSTAEQARLFGHAWEKLPDPRPQLTLEIDKPGGQREFFVLGPHMPHLTSSEVKLLHKLWLRFSDQVAPEEFHHHDMVYFALKEVARELEKSKEEDVLERLKRYIAYQKSHHTKN